MAAAMKSAKYKTPQNKNKMPQKTEWWISDALYV
jgi:hypothetical protein